MPAPVPPFVDTAFVFSDDAQGNLLVKNGPLTTSVPLAAIDDLIASTPDPTQFLIFNIAARLCLSGTGSIQTAPGSGVASASALALLNAASFKAY